MKESILKHLAPKTVPEREGKLINCSAAQNWCSHISVLDQNLWNWRKNNKCPGTTPHCAESLVVRSLELVELVELVDQVSHLELFLEKLCLTECAPRHLHTEHTLLITLAFSRYPGCTSSEVSLGSYCFLRWCCSLCLCPL